MSRSDCGSGIYKRPLALLRAVNEHAMSFQEARYEMVIISIRENLCILGANNMKEKC
jgi:hypothetical protein